jgi:SAM-dependent methyltransferase
VGEDSVFEAYQAFAPVYNEFNHLNDYEAWVGGALLPELEKHGLKRGRVLDIGCGTGRAFAPLLSRGWEITGCDLSPAMLEFARHEAAGRVPLEVADMRELPVFGQFELVLSLNDPVNYLFDRDELERTFTGMRANLADDGLLIFDCNSQSTFETTYSTTIREVEQNGRKWTWRGAGELSPDVYESRIEGDGIDDPISHRERFWPEAEVRTGLQTAGLECLAVLGMDEVDGEILLQEPPDESHHYKIIYIAKKAS